MNDEELVLPPVTKLPICCANCGEHLIVPASFAPAIHRTLLEGYTAAVLCFFCDNLNMVTDKRQGGMLNKIITPDVQEMIHEWE